LSFKPIVLPERDEYLRAVQTLREGGIVAYPTETYYGLAVDPLNPDAVKALYRLKQREQKKALSFLVPDVKILTSYISHFPQPYTILTAKLWPGPLTLIFNAAEDCPPPCKKEDSSLAIRISSHPVAQHLCSLWGNAITASSANISGEKPIDNAKAVRKQWGDHIDYILDGGKSAGKAASTIVVAKGEVVKILRAGVIPETEIRQLLPSYYTICKS